MSNTITAFSRTSDERSIWAFTGDYSALRVRLSDGRREVLEMSNVPWSRDTVALLSRDLGGIRSQKVGGTQAIPRGTAFVWGADSAGLIWATAFLLPNSVIRGSANIQGSQREQFVEVVDPVRRELLISRKMPALMIVGGTNLAFSMTVDADGVRRYTLHRVSLRRN